MPAHNHSDTREVFNQRQGARYCGLSTMTFRKHLSEIPHRRLGRHVLIRKVALDAWLESRDNAASSKAEGE